MAAPSGIVWGSIVGGYGRIGIYKSLSNTTTQTTATVEIWFWSKYSVSDTANTLYYSNLASTGSATGSVGTMSVNTTVASGEGWSTTNQILLKSYSYTYTRGTSAATRYLYAKLINVDRVGGAMYASTTFTVPALPSYTVSYNANGGSGAPSSQTKWHGTTLKLSSTKPTRTGYTFQGWATSASGNVAYAVGANYTGNAALTLYAKWTPNTYTVTYDANGGTDAPASQTKAHDVALTLTRVVPYKEGCWVDGWATSPNGKVVYAPGATYTANANIVLYAVYVNSYVKPRIYNLRAFRCDAEGYEQDDGVYMRVIFDWEIEGDLLKCRISWGNNDGERYDDEAYCEEMSTDGLISERYDEIIPGVTFSVDKSYKITVTLNDTGDDKYDSSAVTTLPGALFPIDALAGGNGVSFGKPAEFEGVADFGFDAKFNKPVYGKALGMDRVPAVPADSDLNDYMEPGCYAVYSNAAAATITNIPVDRAGRLEVWSSTGEGVRLEQWSYLRQRFIPYNSSNAVWEREITRSADNVWHYYEWWKSSLTPAVSEKVYAKAAATVALSANVTLGNVNTYTKIPFDKLAISTSDRLTLSSNSIRIGANISHVKVSGQTLVKCGSQTGNRHARIQKVSDGITTSIAWDCIYGVGTSNTLYPFTPVIVSVKEGDLLHMVYYTGDSEDSNVSGSAANGWQTYITVEEL